MKNSIVPTLGLILLGATSCAVHQKNETKRSARAERGRADLVKYANPMCGTGTAQNVPAGDNNTYPGATLPFGMIQWSPDTEMGQHRGGYGYADMHISDFSVDHISGAGCGYGGDFAMMPILGTTPASPPTNRAAFAASFSHTNETATPGFYAVIFENGIKVELTVTMRTGFGRFTYPENGPMTMMINAASDANHSDDSAIEINPEARELSGWSLGGKFCRTHETRKIYFYLVFDRPFEQFSAWSGDTLTAGATNGSGKASGAFITFGNSENRTVLAKIGISYVSAANAKANMMAENPVSAFSSKDFDKLAAGDRDLWNSWLNKIEVSGGTADDLTTFYSMFYHALLGPVVVSDVNGEYTGYDGQVHKTEDGRAQYGIFSGWDVYRSECQFLGMIAPKEASDMAQTLLVDYQQGGTFPRWGVITEDSGVMMGDPAAAMIPDFYMFGARNFDTKAALDGLVHAATDPSVNAPRTKTHERDALEDYLQLGYVPEHQKGGYGNVSMTEEYDSADFALAQFAKALGDDADYATLMLHAQNWTNLYNPESGYLEMRRRDGSWAPGFTNNVGRYDSNQAYVEGTAGQYVWMIPFNLKGLADMMGGPDAAAKRLDAFFTRLNVGDRGPDSWMAWVGNEPNLNTPWIYDFLGQPWKTQSTVRRVMRQLYSPGPAAYPGNDDVGEMSSWYIFSALGMYPELPGSDVLVLGSPLFSKAVIHLQSGDITIIGENAAKDVPYVQSMILNGRPSSKLWVRLPDISHGGMLVYDLGTRPNKSWGSNPWDAPPSYGASK